jgi:hypothetical protein
MFFNIYERVKIQVPAMGGQKQSAIGPLTFLKCVAEFTMKDTIGRSEILKNKFHGMVTHYSKLPECSRTLVSQSNHKTDFYVFS